MGFPRRASHTERPSLIEKKDRRRERERHEAKRQEFVKHLTSKAQKTIVYVDEAGMDNRDDYAYGWNE